LVTAGGVALKTLAEKLGFSSGHALRAKAYRLGATGKGDLGREVLDTLNEDGIDPLDFVGEFLLDSTEEEVDEPVCEAKQCPGHVVTVLPNRTITVASETHRQMKMDYSEWGGTNLSQAQMAAKYGLTKQEFSKYKTIHGWTKAEDGYTDEEIMEADVDELAKALVERRALLQKTVVDRQIQKDAKDAAKWRSLQAGVWKPFVDASESPIPYDVPKVKFSPRKTNPKRKLIVNANDWQIGELAQRSELVRGEDWNTEIAKNAIVKYAEKIADHIHYSGYDYDEAYLCSLGDLGHGLNGFTAHGTHLEVDSTRQEQVKAILFCLRTLIDSLRQLVPFVNVHHVEGNHLGFTSTLIFDQVSAWYGGENPVKDVAVVNNYLPVQYVPVAGKTLLVLYHGKTGGPSRGMATSGTRRERDAYHLIMEGVRKYPNHTNVNLLTGHVHHRILEEFSDVTIHTLGTIVAGDHYADQNMLTGSVPTQNIMELDPETGLITSIPITVVSK
tara:strand:+ start:1892 stop:3391 length:1500 start_codon:yes stop_codon:yes gene_type:complete